MQKSKSSVLLSKHTKHVAILFVFWLCYVAIGVGCPVYSLLGVPCPTCGVTRALMGLLSGDWHKYLCMNPFAIPLVIAIVICIHLPAILGKWKKLANCYVVTIAVSNFCWYIFGFLR